MSILLILSYFDPFYGPKAFISLPIDITKEKEKEITYFINVPSEDKFIETISFVDKQKIINFPFTIRSDWARGYKEQLLLSVILDKNYKSEVFEKSIKNIVKTIQSAPNLYKAFYKEQENFSLDPDIDDVLKILNDLLLNGYQALNQDLKEISLGNFLVLGLAKVGKTSILENLKSNVFNPNIKPTLATDVLKVILETFKFRAIDVSGQKKLRYQWWERVRKPDAIIFVVDGTHSIEELKESKSEFHKILEHYREDNENQLDSNVPILVCINKVDLIDDKEGRKNEIFTIMEIENCCAINKVQLTSAVTGEGIKEGFKWIFQELLKIA